MIKKIVRQLFSGKEMAARLSTVEKRIAQYQGVIDYLLAASGMTSDDAKDLAYFFHMKRNEAHGQVLQDLWALWETKGKRNGYFVEFGAADGKNLSNTFLLEERYGWTGILAEPMPGWHDKLKERKAIVDTRCVWTKTGEKLSFLCSAEPELSGLKVTGDRDHHTANRKVSKNIEVQTISLDDLLEGHGAPQVIDYISIDTEGSEYEILAHFDFLKHQFNLISVEHNWGPQRDLLRDLLAKKGYLRVFGEFSQFDDWYVHRSMRGQ